MSTRVYLQIAAGLGLAFPEKGIFRGLSLQACQHPLYILPCPYTPQHTNLSICYLSVTLLVLLSDLVSTSRLLTV